MLLKLFILTNRHFAAPLKENKIKNYGFADSEFVKICHEQVTCHNNDISNRRCNFFPGDPSRNYYNDYVKRSYTDLCHNDR